MGAGIRGESVGVTRSQLRAMPQCKVCLVGEPLAGTMHSIAPHCAIVGQAWLPCIVKIHAAIPIVAMNREQRSTALAYRPGLTSGEKKKEKTLRFSAIIMGVF